MDDILLTLPPVLRREMQTITAKAIPWDLALIHAPSYWPKTDAGLDIPIGVADSGIDTGHPEFEGRIAEARSFVRGGSPEDKNGHGTHVAAKIVGNTVGGAPKAKVYSAAVLNANGTGRNKDCARGLDWLGECGVKIVNISWAAAHDDPYTRGAVLALIQSGVIVICASGNSGALNEFPARHGCCVNAIDKEYRLADFSSRGAWTDCADFGVGITSAVPGGYATWDGTSMAAPGITWKGANLLSLERKVFGEIRTKHHSDLLKHSRDAIDLGTPGRDDMFGYGAPDIDKLFSLGADVDDQPAPPEDGSMMGRFEEVGGRQRVWNGTLHLERNPEQ